MLKRISVSELRVGMYVDELCGSWMEHPFWRTRFSLKDTRDVERIAASGIQEVWIDTDKGVDADPLNPTMSTRAQADAEIERKLQSAASEPGEATDHVPFAE